SHLNSGSDRQTEIWKSFGRLSQLSGKYYTPEPGEKPYVDGYQGHAYRNGARYQNGGGIYYGNQAQNGSPGSGYAGWMYRDVCVTEGAGAYRDFDTAGTRAPNAVHLLD